MSRNLVEFRVKSKEESRLIAHVQESAERSKEWPMWKQTLLSTNTRDTNSNSSNTINCKARQEL